MTRDHKTADSPPNHNGPKAGRIDLGLAILSAVAKPRATHSAGEIAAWCDCTPAMIRAIELRALRRLRLRLNSDPNSSQLEMREAIQFFEASSQT
jgi:hypothetical protein